jgi:hypothetical protein
MHRRERRAGRLEVLLKSARMYGIIETRGRASSILVYVLFQVSF